jgi:hypothetical protein
MARLGTYTTFDCPVDEVKTAEGLAWLKEKFEAIDGSVRQVMNDHDFGGYPSFEIDYPEHLEYIDENDESESEETIEELSEWHNKANDIEAEFNEKFHGEE